MFLDFFFDDTETTEFHTYWHTLSRHDALPISLDAVITRGKTILPASEVPNLAEGDRIWLKPEFPKSQSAHYLMVAAFLSGPTNPPPKDWFFSCKTWTGKCARAGLTVTVPPGAQQVLAFLEIGRASCRERGGQTGEI